MGSETNMVIARLPPEDGRNWEPQCARCGSSVHFDHCDSCGGEGIDPFGHDCGEDTCCCLDPEPNLSCGSCGGVGGWRRCLSGEEWCKAHPMNGRESVESGAIEWFMVERAQS